MRAAAILVVLCLSAATADADLKQSVKYDHYDIYGKTAEDLRQEMNRKGFIDSQGDRHDGYTAWNVDWTLKYRTKAGRCGIASADVNLQVTYHLPRWVSPIKASQEVRSKWDAYLTALKKHEKGHEDFALAAAKDVETALITKSTTEDCQELGRQANELGQQILEKYVTEEIDYDIETKHGETQGAVFP